MTVLAFFYLWYATPAYDGYYNHWNHTVLPHWTSSINKQYPSIGSSFSPPASLHSVDTPLIGPYSSGDPATLDNQFKDMRSANIDVAVVSWWGRPEVTKGDSQGTSTDERIEGVLSAARGYERPAESAKQEVGGGEWGALAREKQI